jgi:hypothetical protein
MTRIQQDRYKEIKDWLKITSPYIAVFILTFKMGAVYQDFKQRTVKWDAYESTIVSHEEADNRIHSEFWKQIDSVKREVFLVSQTQ